MSDCCSQSCTKETIPRKRVCPANQKQYTRVSVKTILHHIQQPWKYYFKEQGYYYCADDNCDVVYFGEDGQTIHKHELRTQESEMQKFNEVMLCYCFGVSMRDAKSNPAIKAFVIQHTKLGNCACEARNPSGSCCLKDFP